MVDISHTVHIYGEENYICKKGSNALSEFMAQDIQKTVLILVFVTMSSYCN